MRIPQANEQKTAFEAQLQRARAQAVPDRYRADEQTGPETVIIEPNYQKPAQDEVPTMPPGAPETTPSTSAPRPSQTFIGAIQLLRRRHPALSQARIGWVAAGISRELTDNPALSKRDLKALIDSLVQASPEYDGPQYENQAA